MSQYERKFLIERETSSKNRQMNKFSKVVTNCGWTFCWCCWIQRKPSLDPNLNVDSTKWCWVIVNMWERKKKLHNLFQLHHKTPQLSTEITSIFSQVTTSDINIKQQKKVMKSADEISEEGKEVVVSLKLKLIYKVFNVKKDCLLIFYIQLVSFSFSLSFTYVSLNDVELLQLLLSSITPRLRVEDTTRRKSSNYQLGKVDESTKERRCWSV